MNNKQIEIGKRIQAARKQKRLSQSELAKALDKSLRTIQKYESGEIEVSIAIINTLAKLLDTTPTHLIGYKTADSQLKSFSNVIDVLFQLQELKDVNFSIDVKRPPHHDNWECSLVFNGKDNTAEHNADLCLFLEEFREYVEDLETKAISRKKYQQWQNETIAYYTAGDHADDNN